MEKLQPHDVNDKQNRVNRLGDRFSVGSVHQANANQIKSPALLFSSIPYRILIKVKQSSEKRSKGLRRTLDQFVLGHQSMASSWKRSIGNVRSFIGNSMGGLRGGQSAASWVVAGTIAYFLWIKPAQDLKKEQEVPILISHPKVGCFWNL